MKPDHLIKTLSIRRIVVLSALILSSLGTALPSSAHHYSAIQPGARLLSGGTFNFVFKSRGVTPAKYYIGTCGHCVSKVGQRVSVAGLGEIGTVVFLDLTYELPQANDFALIEIDRAKYKHIEPSLRFWGGPSGIERRYEPGSVTLHYGQSFVWHVTEPTRAKKGILEYLKDDHWGAFANWYVAAAEGIGGDSGSGVITGDGKALGVVSIIAHGDKGTISGPTIELELELLRKNGFDVTLVTSKFKPITDPVANAERVRGTAQHCAANPVGDAESNPDGCVRALP